MRKQISVALPESLKDKLQAIATKENRTMTNLVAHIVTKYLEQLENDESND